MECDHTKALDHIRERRWSDARKIVSECHDKLSCLIRAYLFRVEGNNSEAENWYKCANVNMPSNNLEDELNHLYEILISKKNETR